MPLPHCHQMQRKALLLVASRPEVPHPDRFFLLQGVWPGAYKPGDVEELQRFPQRVLGHMIGNAMSVCVVRRLVRCIFQARGIL